MKIKFKIKELFPPEEIEENLQILETLLEMAFNISSEQAPLTEKECSDYLNFVEKVREMFPETEHDNHDFIHDVAKALPGDTWLQKYLEAIPQMNDYLEKYEATHQVSNKPH